MSLTCPFCGSAVSSSNPHSFKCGTPRLGGGSCGWPSVKCATSWNDGELVTVPVGYVQHLEKRLLLAIDTIERLELSE